MPIAAPCIAKRWSSNDAARAGAGDSIVREMVGAVVVSTPYVSGRWVILLHAQSRAAEAPNLNLKLQAPNNAETRKEEKEKRNGRALEIFFLPLAVYLELGA
jgi:hypothetical protein